VTSEAERRAENRRKVALLGNEDTAKAFQAELAKRNHERLKLRRRGKASRYKEAWDADAA
jgi:hypothetical protein